MKSYQPEDYASYRLQRAEETIREVDIHIEHQLWNTAVNRMYYACFYAVSALLIKHGVETLTHSGTRQKFGQLFVKTELVDRSLAKLYSDLFDKRHKGDYNDFFDHNEVSVLRLYPMSKQFVDKIKELVASTL